MRILVQLAAADAITTQTAMKQIFRSWRNNLGFTLIVLAILAIGIGSTTAIFSLSYSILLKPFPFDNPDQLVILQTRSVKLRGTVQNVSLADFEDLRRKSKSFTSMAAYRPERFGLIEGGTTQPVEYARITPELFSTLGVNPQLGQAFQPSDDQPGGASNKAIISHSLWQRRFNLDPGIIGRTIRTSVNTLTIVGVMPANFSFPGNTDMWVPIQNLLQVRKLSREAEREYRSYNVVARLNPGSSIAAGQAELDRIGEELERTHPVTNEGLRTLATNLRDATVGEIRPYLWLLFASVTLVLAICAANSANLFLARASARTREFSIRGALGADPGRIIRDQLKESFALSALGGILGLLLANTLVSAFPRYAGQQIPSWIHVHLDWTVLVFSIGIAILTGISFGIIPAILASRANLQDVLKEGARGSSGAGRLKQGLVISEVALAAMLLISAGLLLRTLNQLQRVELGFNPSNLLTIQLSPFVPGENKERIKLSTNYFERAIGRLRQIPGVESAGATDEFPFSQLNASRPTFQLEAKGELRAESIQRKPSSLIDITPDYFAALGIPLLEGRAFRESDTLETPWVIILSERAAKAFFPGRPALGQQIRINSNGATDPWATVIGVVGNVKYRANESDQALEFYYPYKQYGLSSTRVALRLSAPRQGIEQEIRQALQEVDVQTPMENIRPMSSLIDESLWQQRLWATLLAGFAAAALVLSVLGLYGVLSFSVNQRFREIGIRLAIGARPLQVLSMIVGDGLRLVILGLVMGVFGALALGRLMEGLLFSVSWLDPITYAIVLLILPLAGLLAAALPALRATRVDPVHALKSE
ncbi:MAG: ABC transporter permease [Acidobacteria bacterium]|nr:ABC transporter permease [Acidobacteriota bacterium]